MPRTRISAPLCCCQSLGGGQPATCSAPLGKNSPGFTRWLQGDPLQAGSDPANCLRRWKAQGPRPPFLTHSLAPAVTGSVDVPVTRGHVDDTHPAHKDTSGDVRLPTCGQRTPWPQACVLRDAVMSAL